LGTKIKAKYAELWDTESQNNVKWSKVSQIMSKIDSLAPSSPCKKLKVAYALVDSSYNIIEYATNGYEENGEPCSNSDENHHCIHAEIRLIEKISDRRLSVEDCIFIGNFSPCSKCMNELVNLGIGEVIFKEFFHDLTGARARVDK
jgi:deoxycytidylate deaminase